jgi:beta-lactamase regulating signal transducer with metallopeptidase domain
MSSLLPAALADHALLVCGGLLAAAALAWPARRLLRRDPATCYRLLLALLVGAVAVVPLQWVVAGRAAPLAAPLRDWLRARTRPEPARPGPGREGPLVERTPSGTYVVDAAPLPSHARIGRSAASGALSFDGVDAVETAAAPPIGALLADDRAPPEKRFDLSDFADLAAGLWLAGVGAIATRRLLRAARTHRLIRNARDVSDPEVLAVWRRVGRDARGAARIRLVESAAVASPACAGLVRRVVLLPERRDVAALPPGVLEWALRHELVHLERGDPWAALFQSAVTALLWFHPAAWWLSAEIGRQRELSCDQQVVEGSGRRRSYALALLEFAACVSRPVPAIDADPHSAGMRHALLHWSRSPSQIRRRIEMLTVDSASLPRARKWFGALVAGCAFAVPAIAQVAGAATLLPPRPQETKPAPAAVPPAPAAPAARPSALELPALASTPVADDPNTPAPPPPRTRRHVNVPAGLAAPAQASAPSLPQEAPAPPAPALAPPPTGRATAVRARAGDGEVAEVEAEAGELPDLDDVADCNAACAAGMGDGDEVGDDVGPRISAIVQEHLRTAHRQIEQAVHQAQRGQDARQRDLERELARVEQQAERSRTQGEQRRDTLKRKLAAAGDDDRRAQLEKELVDLENAGQLQSNEHTKHLADLESELAALQTVDFDECADSLSALDDANAADLRKVEQEIEAGRAGQRGAAAKRQALGYVAEDDGRQDGDGKGADSRRIRAAIERALAESRAATERACAQASEAVAKARQSGALDAATQQQVERSLAQARKIDTEKIRRQIESELRTAQSATKGAYARTGPTAADPAMARTPTPPTPPMHPRSPRAGSPPRPNDTAPEHAAQLQDRIQVLEAQIEALRAELEALRQQTPAPAPPARHGRTMH